MSYDSYGNPRDNQGQIYSTTDGNPGTGGQRVEIIGNNGDRTTGTMIGGTAVADRRD